jgi:hypothetical protein
MTKHKTEDYKNSAVKYYLNKIEEMDIRKHVKSLIVRNPLYEIGLHLFSFQMPNIYKID